MLLEALKYLLTPCPAEVRALGHLSESIALEARHRRCARAWAPHLERSRACILEAAQACPGRGTVLVLGSGLLLDVPLADLAARFERVLLCDAFHPPRARRAARCLPNVALVTRDLTGLGSRLLADLRAGRQPDLATPPPPDPAGFGSADLTVSCNLLSQLPLPPLRLLLRRGNRRGLALAPEDLDRLGREIVAAHLDWLAGLPGRVCLITDRERRREGGDGALERDDPLFGVELPPPDREWVWDIAPRPELARDRDVRHLVAGYLDFAAALARGREKSA